MDSYIDQKNVKVVFMKNANQGGQHKYNAIQVYKYQYQYWYLAKNNHRSDTAEIFVGVRFSLRNEKSVSRISGLRSKESFISIICLRCPWSEKEEKLK